MSDISPVFGMADILGVRVEISGFRAEKENSIK
jgi:hypothetical protein